jgi:thiol-disulfide isomerase/thioredoxin
MKFPERALDRAANLAIVIAVIVFLVLVGRGQFFHKAVSKAKAADENLVGRTISLPGAKLAPGRNSLVLVASTVCHFCEASMPFYKDLSGKLRGRVSFLAVFPQGVEESTKYLAAKGVRVDQVLSAEPPAVGVRGTPTVLLVDGNGVVRDAWYGQLDETGQAKLLSTVIPESRAGL